MRLAQIKERKIKSLEELLKQVNGLKIKGEKIVFTNGCFDLLHQGHLHTLAEAKAMGSKLIVGINTDSSVKKLKGNTRPIQNQDQRALHLAALSFVDFVVLFEDQTPKKLIEAILPSVLVKGGDYTIEDIVGAKKVLEHGGEVKTISFLEGHSTTNIISKIQKA